MFKITWDKDTGGIQLSSKVTKETLGISPRPVFFEELNLLGLDKQGWIYPRGEAPIMWAVNKQYWYRGELLFEAKGANIYDPATIIYAPGISPMTLTEIDVSAMLERNADQMFLIESEAIEFIRDTYVAYAGINRAHKAIKANQDIDFEALASQLEKKTKKKMAVVKEDCDSFDIVPLDTANKSGKKVVLSTKIDRFIASFSGGKDSQVVLDLCTRAIPPTDFEVIYSDTGYELPPSLELYEEVKRHYGERFPSLKFRTTKNHESVLNYWDNIGTPSDTHRWCCSVMKTAPLYRSLKVDGNKQARVLTFDGVRAEESLKREAYERVGKGKHTYIVNAHPIIKWNTSEIFLYLFKYSLPINPAYRFGKARVGCIVCPFSSSWDDMIIGNKYPKELKPFTDRISSYCNQAKIKDFPIFLKERKWKIKSLGNVDNLPKVSFDQRDGNFVATINNAKQEILSWLYALCEYSVAKTNDGYKGELKFKEGIYPFSIKGSKKGIVKFTVFGINNLTSIFGLKRIAYKSANCIQCEVCEVDCPTGALTIYPKLNIDKTKCIHCHKCLTAHDRGCIVADSLRMIIDTDNNFSQAIQGYKKFGLRQEWADEFFTDPEEFWDAGSWGEPMYDAFRTWCKDAGILVNEPKSHKLTPLGARLTKIYDEFPNLVWEIIWINITRNSYIANRFIRYIQVNQEFDKKSLRDIISEAEPPKSLRTLENAILALNDTFCKSPIGEGLMQGMDFNKAKIRRPFEEVSAEAIAYSLYRCAEDKDTKYIRVSDLYRPEETTGPFKEFGISRNELYKKLRFLSSDKNRVLIAELNMGLEHITLRDDLDSLSALKTMLSL